MNTIPPYNDDDRQLEDEIRTREKSRDLGDDDHAPGTRVPVPRKPKRPEATALPEPDEDEVSS